MQLFIKDEDGNEIPVVTSWEEGETLNDITAYMLDNNETEFGNYRLEEIAPEEIECYDWSESEQEAVDSCKPGSELFILHNRIGDFEQPLGVVAVIW